MNKIITETKNFKFYETGGVGIEDTPYTRLEVESKGLAKKHVVEICLFSDCPGFNGKPVQYRYNPNETDIRHGMRMKRDTLDETLEYIEVLKDAVEFAKHVNAWINAHPEWKFS